MRKLISNLLEQPRWMLLLISSLSITGLMIYSAFMGNVKYLEKMNQLDHPVKYANSAICIPFVTIKSINEGHIIGYDRKNTYVFINQSPISIQINQEYSFTGSITPEGKIMIKEIQHHPYRLLKYFFSTMPIFLVIYFIKKYIRIIKQDLSLTIDMSGEDVF